MADVSDSTDQSHAIERAQEICEGAEAVLIAAGAGMGVDSGLPDFRGDEGFWNAYPPYRRLGVSFIEMANPGHFRHDPEFGWGFYGHRRNLYRATVPHEGFRLLRRFGESRPGGVFVFTSNVDGQFQKAGFDPDRIIECHGSIEHEQCQEGCGRAIWTAAEGEIAIDEATMRAMPPLPSCPGCGGLARPNILMFGDWLWDIARARRQQERYAGWLRSIENLRLVILEFGAGTAIATVRMESERRARHPAATLIRVNPRAPQGPPGTISIPTGALEAIRRVI